MEIKNFFHLFWKEKIPENKAELPVFYFESLLRLFQQWEKCKNHRNGCYSCCNASCQVWNLKTVEKKSYDSFKSPGPRQHFCFSTLSENAPASSCALPIAK